MNTVDIEQPLVSVIMPTYNHAKFIGDAIGSVLNQTHKNLELTIIDNYSEDNTEEIIRSFNEPRIRYMKFRNNGIIGASRNQGIRHAAGKYIAFLDSDDIWIPEKLEKQVKFLNNNPDIGLVYSNAEYFGNTVCAGRKMLGRIKAKSGFVLKDLVFCNFIPTLTVLCRKECLLSIGFFNEREDFCSAEDHELWLRLASKYKISYLDMVLAKYRIDNDSSSRRVNRGKLNKCLFLYCLEAYPKTFDIIGRKKINRHIKFLTVQSGIILWKNRKNSDARKEFLKASNICNKISIGNILIYLLCLLSLFDYKHFEKVNRFYLLLITKKG